MWSPVLRVWLLIELQQSSLCGRHCQSTDTVSPRFHTAIQHRTFHTFINLSQSLLLCRCLCIICLCLRSMLCVSVFAWTLKPVTSTNERMNERSWQCGHATTTLHCPKTHPENQTEILMLYITRYIYYFHGTDLAVQ